ncbi:FAD-dependent oxidoreductase [Mucilaginibacter sp.]|uniref:FAD-dependent oxidoreductase n=1 Tax=Mucilaginibacter sp. TaxID=1882438 RepID=UPI00326531F4
MHKTQFKIKLLLAICMWFTLAAHAQPAASGLKVQKYDLVIVGGTPAGIMAAIAAARLGKTSVILERTAHVGGLPANGLGATDIATRGATTGLFTEFVARVKRYYTDKYGAASEQVKACSDGYHFEPSVAEQIFGAMLKEGSGKITVLKMRQFDAEPQSIELISGKITRVTVLNRETKEMEAFAGSVFIDATYEGDLGAAAKIPFRVGREGKDEFNEPGAGRVYKYWGGAEGPGTTNQADNAVQSYNYRICLTNDASNSIAVEKPAKYNRDEYVSMIEDVWTGKNTGVQMQEVSAAMMEDNRKTLAGGGITKIPGDRWGIGKITNMVPLPNHKTDGNNQHMAFISTDLPEENWPWPTSDWAWRDTFAQRLKEYTLGLIYFAQNDKELPESFRKATKEWGLAKDEYTDNGNFPRQVYIREGRRFEATYFFTAKDAIAVSPGKRPPVHPSSVTASHYALDSHAVRKREPGKIHLDGFISYPTSVYTVPLGVMVPKQVDNLILPVPVSGSHIGFSTIRMEPCWMALGQAAGIAASLAIDNHSSIKSVNNDLLQNTLIDQKATLIYYKDIDPSSPDFKMVQLMGLKGYLPDWEARLDAPVDNQQAALWCKLSGLKTKFNPGITTRREMLTKIYKSTSKVK